MGKLIYFLSTKPYVLNFIIKYERFIPKGGTPETGPNLISTLWFIAMLYVFRNTISYQRMRAHQRYGIDMLWEINQQRLWGNKRAC